MHFGIGRDRDVEVGDALEARHEIEGVGIAAGMGTVGGLARRGIAAQGHDVADARRPVIARDVIDLGARGTRRSVRCAAGSSEVSLRMRRTVAWVRARVEPPAP